MRTRSAFPGGWGGRAVGWAFLAVALLGRPVPLPAADHGDTPFLQEIARHDARVTDLFAFTRGEDLVLVLCSNPAIPSSVTSYRFASDLEFEIFLDNHSQVAADDPDGLGGTVLDPDRIREDFCFRIRFDAAGEPRIHVNARDGRDARRIREEIRCFVGLRDDPFIRGPRIGRNVAAIVLQLPLEEVTDRQSTLLAWAHSRILDLGDAPTRIADSAGRALRSQFPEGLDLNFLHPCHHARKLGLAPDVLIFDTDYAASFPNGREPTDDVVDLVGDPRVLRDDAPFPATNDVPFLDEFPYLGEPHRP